MLEFLGAIFAPIISAITSLFVAILTPVLTPVFELLALIIGAILHFLLALVANVFGGSWMAAHTKGTKRLGYAVIALTSAHLLAGIILPATGTAPLALLSWFFSPLAMLLSFVLLVLGAVLVMAAGLDTSAPVQPRQTAPEPVTRELSIGFAKDLVTHGMAVVFALVVFVGVASFSTAQTERKSLREELCDSAAAKVSQTWKDRGKKALNLSERLLKRDLKDKFPCPIKD